MDVYPLDLILAIAVASATVFLGFLPTKNIRSPFFGREVLKAIIAWAVVGILSPPAVMHYPGFFAILCLVSCRHFRRDNALSGKMWLSIASGLGISVGIVFILAVTPRAFPVGLPQQDQTLLLASMYLGGAVIGLAYICYALTESARTNPGITQGIIQRYTGLLLALTLARAAVLLANFFLIPGHFDSKSGSPADVPLTLHPGTTGTDASVSIYYTKTTMSSPTLIVLALIVLVLPLLAQLARGSSRFSSHLLPARALAAIGLLGLVAEMIARLLML